MSTSPQLLRSWDLDQLLRLRRGGNDQVQVGDKSLKSFEQWKFWGKKFLTIALSLKDIELGLKGPIERFPSINLQSVAGWEYACLSQKTA